MKTALLVIAIPCALFAQVSVEITGVTSTQAVLQIRGAAAPCTLELRENDGDGPVHPDVPTGTEDTARPDTLVWQDGTRIVTLGHQRSNLALFAGTSWYGSVSGCTEPQTFTFRTANPPLGANWVRSVPFNPAKWNNADYPAIDWSPAGRNTSYADPVSGLRMKVVNTGDFSFLYGPVPFETWAGGSGWTNPAAAANGGQNSVASTSGTSPLDLYPLLKDGPAGYGWGDWRSLDNIGLVIYGSGTEGAGGEEDRKADICIFFNPAEGCAGTPFRITLPSGGVAKLNSTGKDPDAAFPAEFPDAMFAGWGGAVITHDRYGVVGNADAASGALRIANPHKFSYFPATLNPGNLMEIRESGCTPNNLCTITNVEHAGALTVASGFSGTNVPFAVYPWGIRVRKVTSSGSIRIGLQHKFSGTHNSQTTAEGSTCHPVPVVSGDGITGNACAIHTDASTRRLYFISTDGMTRRAISPLRIPHSQFRGSPAEDQPSGLHNTTVAPLAFSPSEGNVFYASVPSVTNKRSIYKLTYKGDWTKEITATGGWGGEFGEAGDDIVWENITPASEGKDLQAQIARRYPEYNTAAYGSWDWAGFVGISGSKAFFARLPGGQDGGPCWIAAVDLASGSVTALYNTLTGSGPNEIMWGNCHSIQPVAWPPNTMFVSLNVLNLNSSSRLAGGPFEVKPGAVLRGGQWSSDTSLPWPIDDSYDNTCPADISEEAKQFGAVGNQCVTLRLPGNPCNMAPSPGEAGLFPACNWNPALTQPAQLRPGNHITDSAAFGGGDSEPLRVVKVSSLPNGELVVVAQRNAVWDYCCVTGTRSESCVNSASQARHANGWTIRMYPGSGNSCNDASFYINFTDAGPRSYNLPRNLGGHSTIGKNGDNIDFVSGALAKVGVPLSALADVPVTGIPMGFPSFFGTNPSLGPSLVQQYLSRSQLVGEDNNDRTWALDANAYNPGYGYGGGNNLNNSLGPRPLSRVSGDVWKIGILGGLDYKKLPLIGWVGSRILKDISGPGSNILTAADYSLCHALYDGECGTGSAGETFIKAPRIYPAPNCISAMVWANVPCVVTAQPGVGGVRQFSIAAPDPYGANSRFLTYGFAAPGIHNPFWSAMVHPGGKAFLVNSGQYLEGVRMASLLFRLPEWEPPSGIRNGFSKLNVRIPGRDGATHARVRFGYNTSLECTERKESCVTDSAHSPFAFEGEAKVPLACSEGCEVEVSALSGRVLYYQAEWLAEGNIVETGERTAVVAP